MLKPEQLQFLSTAAEAAVKSERKTGCAAEITLAQAVLESGWGKHQPPGSFNLFGIKDTSRHEGETYCFTKEWIGGKEQTLKLAFEVFPNYTAAFEDHGRLITGGFDPKKPNCYWPHFRLYQQDRNLAGYLWGMAAHYATDPSYARQIMSLCVMPELIKAVEAARAKPEGIPA